MLQWRQQKFQQRRKNELLEPMMLSPEERIFGRREISADKIKFNVDLFGERKSLSIYPDTLVWIRDFAYSYNEPLAKRYFSHPFYNNYPVLGINIEQAIAFCQWKTEQINKSLKKAGAAYEVIVRLPTNTEWESAAIGEKDTLSLFYGNHSYGINFGTITDKNGYRVKGYDEDSFFYTSPVKSFPVGDYGLYDMRGNLAEWTTTKASDIINDIQKNNEMLERIKDYYVVKGGGWDSEPFYLQTGTCRFFGAGAAHSFVGFRYVVFIGVKK